MLPSHLRVRTTLCVFLYFLAELSLVRAISTLSVVGSKFFNDDGEQFFIKGIAYQLTPHDPLIDTDQCKRDVSLMKELGANAIRVYHVDPNGDHDGCMKLLADAGIYLFVDLDDFHTQILQDAPTWKETQLDAFRRILDEFQKYDNTAGVFVGNEVVDRKNGSHAAPYILSAARDVKAYRDEKGYRKLPVGYSAADIAELRPMMQNYLVCRPNDSERIDFFALNTYEWCGESTFAQSGYVNLQRQAEGYPVPIFISETGCNTNPPRDFEDLTAVYGFEMSGTWSGAVIYEWIQEANNYGLISYGKADMNGTNDEDIPNSMVMDGYSRQGTPTPVSPDFDNLKSQWATLTPSGVALSDYTRSTASISPPSCPEVTSGNWDVDASSNLPSLGQVFATTTSGSNPTEGGASPSTSAPKRNAAHQQHSPHFPIAIGTLLGLGAIISWSL